MIRAEANVRGHPYRLARRLLPPSTRPDSAPVGCRVKFHGRFRATGLYEALTERHDQLLVDTHRYLMNHVLATNDLELPGCL